MRATSRRLALVVSLPFALLAPLTVAFPASAASQADFSFTVTSGEATITGYLGSDPHIDIPPAIAVGADSYPVTAIGDAAFWATTATSATVPDSVRTVGAYAFGMSSIAAIDLGDSVTTIGREAFARTQLASIVIPDSTVSIDSYAFAYNGLTSLTLGEGLERIGTAAFMQTALGALRVPDSVSRLDDFAFFDAGLTSLTLGSGMTTIGESVFMRNALTSVSIPDSVTHIGMYAFSTNELAEVRLGASVESVGYGAFIANRITSLVLNEGLYEIGDFAFRQNALTAVTIPASVTTMGSDVFYANPLASAIFEGDIPTTFTAGDLLGATNLPTVYHYPQALGFDPAAVGVPVRVIAAASSQLTLDPLASGGSATHRAAVEVRDDAGDPVGGVPVRFTFPAPASASAMTCVTDARGRCGVDATFPAGLAPAARAVIGADADALSVGVFPTPPAPAGPAVPAAPPELAATGPELGSLAGIAFALLAAGVLTRRRARRG
jgi:hypothetical protein